MNRDLMGHNWVHEPTKLYIGICPGMVDLAAQFLVSKEWEGVGLKPAKPDIPKGWRGPA